MTPDERDRLTRLETQHASLDDWVRDIDAKLDKILDAAAMGRGAWWAIIKVGGLLVLLIGGVAWIYDRLPGR